MKGTITIDIERCKGCRLCIDACTRDVLTLSPQNVNRKGYSFCTILQPDACIGCASCAIVCPDACIEVYRQK